MRLFYMLFLVACVSPSAWAVTASYYADKFNGRKTASGETFSNKGMTCASNRYQLGSYVQVTHAKTGKSIVCKVNDRIGKSGRIDLTKTAFAKLAPLSVGLVKVDVEPVSSNQTLSQLSSNAMLPAQIPLDEQPTNMPLVDEINEMLWEESSQKSKPAVATVE